jgi:preprotein translocase subunit SecF
MKIFKSPNFNFVRWRWHALALSAVILAISAVRIWQHGLPLGVEFSGGTIVILQFEQPPDVQRIRTALPDGQNAIVQPYGTPAERLVMIRVPSVGAEEAGNLSETAEAVEAALRQANVGAFKVEGREIVGPIVGEQLTRQGTLATILALGGILVYVALRFQLSFAVGAVIAALHDIVVTLGFLAIFRYDLSLNVIAAILTITGYSVNDTIVIFDRVRENMRAMRRDNVDALINTSVNQTLNRTLITSGTTLLAVTSLFLFGGEVLRGFAFTMIVGVITGTYSSVFIAAAVVTLWKGKKPPQGRAASPSSPDARRASRRRAS